jgi:F-box protein 9
LYVHCLHLPTDPSQLDAKVHDQYKAKHFPPGVYKPPTAPAPVLAPTANTNPSNASPTVPNPAHHSLQGLPPTLSSLLDAFSTLTIQGEAPSTDLSPAPPCPISTIPEELLVEILLHLAIKDVASFIRLSQVCKRLAYLVATEERVWKRIALGHEYGFAAMHYKFARQIDGSPLGDDDLGGHLLRPNLDDPSPTPALPSQVQITSALVPLIYPTYASLFRTRPRLRFNGCYISTVNYLRPGASSANAISWNTPIHIVTYYRYLRFHRDGSCISLLTVSEPADVVPYLSREHVHRKHGVLPSAPMKDAVVGRWRLTGPAMPGAGERAVEDEEEEAEKEGGLLIETPGATPKYIYKLVLAVGSAGRHGCKNNKLSWQGYWSYNKLTDDVGTFSLKNDRPFYWSRVRSWGKGFVEE